VKEWEESGRRRPEKKAGPLAMVDWSSGSVATRSARHNPKENIIHLP